MADDITFDRDLDAAPGEVSELSPLIRRIICNNPSAFTFKGTCSYIVGRGRVAIIDPGPNDPQHVAALLDAVKNETVTHIVVTHTHRDHSPAAAAVKAATGAIITGCGPHRASRPLRPGETAAMEAGGDTDYRPDVEMREDDVVEGAGFRLVAIETPGHAANHTAFVLPQENVLFSGDHVMAWSTSVVGPPGGNMRQYMASLEKLRERGETRYWPGHGGPVKDPRRYVRALITHRRQREAAILGRLKAGDTKIRVIVPKLYEGVPQNLHAAAGMSVLAHLEDLVERGIVKTDGAPAIDGDFRLAG
jgi:glyoxylase-like metal-dependent hydrolase (beta-lactamase superfamily II)